MAPDSCPGFSTIVDAGTGSTTCSTDARGGACALNAKHTAFARASIVRGTSAASFGSAALLRGNAPIAATAAPRSIARRTRRACDGHPPLCDNVSSRDRPARCEPTASDHLPVPMNDSPSTPAVRSRLPATGTSIFSVMSALAVEHGAVNLGQGFPDYPIDPALIDLVTAAMRAGHNQYPLMAGRAGAARGDRRARSGGSTAARYDPEREVTVTTGATQAIFTAIGALAHPGDEVIVFEPAYDSYVPAVRLAGATPVPLPLTFPGYRIDWDARARRGHAAHPLVVVNTPNNPGTSVLAPADLDAARGARPAAPTSSCVSDEVYEHMVYDDRATRASPGTPSSPRAASSIGSFGKTFHATGWKVGYALAPPAITAEMRRVHQFTVFTVNAPMQHALAQFLRRARALRGAARVLRPQARPPARCAGRHPLRAAALRGELLPARPLRRLQRRARSRVRPAAGARGRRGDDPAVGVLPGRHRPPRHPLLLREARRDAHRGRAPAAAAAHPMTPPPPNSRASTCAAWSSRCRRRSTSSASTTSTTASAWA